MLKTFDSGHGPCLGKLTLVRRAEPEPDEEAQHDRERVETVLLKPDDVVRVLLVALLLLTLLLLAPLLMLSLALVLLLVLHVLLLLVPLLLFSGPTRA